MTAALCNYLEHQQEAIYQDIPLERPIIPPVRIYLPLGLPIIPPAIRGSHTNTVVIDDSSRLHTLCHQSV